MPPAREGLDRDDTAAAEVDLWLVVQGYVAFGERAVQVRHQLHVRQRGGVLVGPVPAVAAVRSLRLVHRDIRAAQELVDGPAVLGKAGDADGRLHREQHSLEADRTGQRLGDGGRDGVGGFGVADAGQQHGELVAAHPRHQIARADGALEPVGDTAQQTVTGIVPEGVVDLSEPIEVDQQ